MYDNKMSVQTQMYLAHISVAFYCTYTSNASAQVWLFFKE